MLPSFFARVRTSAAAALCVALLALGGCATTASDAEAAKRAQPVSYESQHALIRARIEQAWVEPRSLAKKPRALAAELRITTDAQGTVKQVKFLKRSGSKDYDASLVKAVLDASPLPMPGDAQLAARFQDFQLRMQYPPAAR